ncbi:MAG: glycosyl transferase family 2 [Bacteroidetes bacterium 4572_77]|nr:MAG: glycosyl transferase family 2 [Bacteroidetes bacterium 4572_77]
MRPLVKAIGLQMKNLNIAVELILIDDASKNYFKQLNQEECKKYQYYELSQNIGRSSIRNLFLKYAQYEHLLFLDGDSYIVEPSFLKNYIHFLQQNEAVNIVCGGRVYNAKKPPKEKLLRWNYGIKRESQTATQRKQFPNHSFMTNNFVVRKELLQNILFDERLKNYGHEDTLFGYELWKKNIPILHVENPIENGDVEDNEVFLFKTEEGVRNLAFIYKDRDCDKQLAQMVSLLMAYEQLKKYHLIFMIQVLFVVFGKSIRAALKKGWISLWLFNFYKLGLLVSSSELSCQKK